jgi:uncharacterized protein YgiM (DUF1202 family)
MVFCLLKLRNLKKYIPVVVVLLLLSFTASVSAQPLLVKANLLNVRSGPGTDNPVLTQVAHSTVLTPVETQGSWTRVILPNGSRGWVFATYTSAYIPSSYATVNVSLLNVRSGPGTDNQVLTQFERDLSVAVLGERNGWLNVLRPEGSQAWLAGWFTDRSQSYGYASANAALLNLRSGPNTGFSVIERLPHGEKLAVIGEDENWRRVVLTSGITGWVHGSYIVWKESLEPGPAPLPEPLPEKPAPSDPPPPESLPAKPAPEQPAPPAAPPVSSTYDTNLNDYVQQVIGTYNGYYPFLLNTDYANYNGVTENLYFGGKLLAKAHPSGNRASHCVGITFEVFFKAMQARNQKLGLAADDFNGMTFDELFDFLLTWYVANGNKRVSNIEVAVEKYGLGKRVARFEEARSGDFMDLSRSNGTGHTVVFQNWVRNNSGHITGVRYWSSQSSGIGFNTEYFDTSGRGNVLSNQVYIARVLPVHQYKSFR